MTIAWAGKTQAEKLEAEVEAEYGPLPGVDGLRGLTFDGTHLWCATGEELRVVELGSARTAQRFPVRSGAGTAFDGQYLYQLDGATIYRIDPKSGTVMAEIPSPEGGGSGMAWAEGSLWVGKYQEGRIYRIDPGSGEILAVLEIGNFVTGVTFANGELWHATPGDDGASLHRLDPNSGAVKERASFQAEAFVTGLTSDGHGTFYCAGVDGKIRAVVVRRGSETAK